MYLVTLLTSDSLSLADIASLWRGRVYKDRYRDQIVTSCGCVSAFQDMYILVTLLTSDSLSLADC